ncbi:MAG: ATP-binding cassette domain-containing protein [Syntrophomonadaceae bacterium]|jgi:ABC-2 type transport system ATP-binding protein
MIEITGLSKSFGNLKAVNNVNLHVKKGEIFGLVGPDGAGKTTLMRMVCGLITPNAGKIQIMGQETEKLSRTNKDQLGYMPQRFSLYGDLTVMENIRFFASLYGLDKKTIQVRAGEVLELTSLGSFTHRLADQLSGGMKQKLALTCALITRPALLVLDEPTYGVDPESRKEFWRILYRLNGSGMTVLVSTPYMDEAELCTRVAFINQGKIAVIDTPAGLRDSFGFTVLDVRAAVKEPHIFKGLTGIRDVSFYGYKYRVVVDDAQTSKTVIKECLRLRHISDVSITQVKPSMEDVFVLLAEKEVM